MTDIAIAECAILEEEEKDEGQEEEEETDEKETDEKEEEGVESCASRINLDCSGNSADNSSQISQPFKIRIRIWNTDPVPEGH